MSSAETDHPERVLLGEHCGRAFSAYFNQAGEWIPIVLAAAAVYVVALLCCVVPVFFAAGPLMCGLHACGLDAIRGRTPEMSRLNRGWEIAGRAVLGSWAILLLQCLPALLIFGVLAGGMATIVQHNPPWWQEFRRGLVVDGPAQQAGLPAADVGAPHDPHGEFHQREVPPDAPAEHVRPPVRRGDADPRVVFLVLAMYASMFVVMGITTIWSFWISTRTLFVLPLMVDQNVGVREAFSLSWSATRQRFWELLFLNLIASFGAAMGLYVCYVGVVFTLPVYFTFVASAYEERFPATDAVPADS